MTGDGAVVNICVLAAFVIVSSSRITSVSIACNPPPPPHRLRYQRLANSAALEALFFPYVFQFILYIAVLLFAILPDDSSHE